MREQCEDCRFFAGWEPPDCETERGGFCHRYPPIHIPPRENEEWLHAVTYRENWCGEFQSRIPRDIDWSTAKLEKHENPPD